MEVEISHLSKRYRGNNFYSLKDVSLSIHEGDILGLIGKNGSGKSTLLKIIAKALRPTEGQVILDGEDLFSRPGRLDRCGLLIETVFYPQLTVEENLDFLIKLHHDEAYRKNIRPLLELVDLWERRKDKPSSFSFGMKQRLALVMALVNEPDFIILDEPFVGLDPLGVEKLIEVLQKAAIQKETSMIISSHQLNELKAICNRYVYIDEGQLTKSFGQESDRMNIILSRKINLEDYLSSDLLAVVELLGDERTLTISSQASGEQRNAILGHLAQEQLIQDIQQGAGLDSYFRGGRLDGTFS
ncbi:ABC transporter ATP-binding protein [Aerococcus sp. UMB9870]|uniref:ABC transporter ATP-binding protein n=1 Tax=Aerococcus sp. UMB9870 TaxID=3046351 RepID=UPI002550D5FC|nr:ABC transporter ATP-binding protein [Aerococcus sp. UMB9870]MDK6369212.1 ABC transporter ATP-binding protein [Aerococcus sp. UMB9870]